jgi:hypothetical protein
MLGSLVLSSGTYPDLRDPVVAETPRDGGGPSAPNDERVQRIESESHMHQGTALGGVPSPPGAAARHPTGSLSSKQNNASLTVPGKEEELKRAGNHRISRSDMHPTVASLARPLQWKYTGYKMCN